MALAGAYEAAAAAGVHFAEVAGTSGGAIVAALIGAGASPKQITALLSGLDFNNFVRPPEESESTGGFGQTLLNTLLSVPFTPETTAAGTYLRFGGLHSSSYIEQWMEEKLAQLLPYKKRPIRFSDLPVPTYIVATDLLAAKVKVWSANKTPEESVAFAVRASCSIPFFFQPVRQGENRYVDGGILSNLPTFVFHDEGRGNRPTPNRVLAFGLSADVEPYLTWSSKELIDRVVTAAVDGSTDLQAQIQRNVHIIEIPTKRIRATDFDKMNNEVIQELTQAGRKSVSDFIKNERQRVIQMDGAQKTCRDSDEIFNAVVEAAIQLPGELLIAARDTQWVWKLFPTIVFLKARGCRISVVLEPIKGGDDTQRKRESYRRALLAELGVALAEQSELPVTGYFFDPKSDPKCAAIIHCPKFNDYSAEGIVYKG
ncbi:MAG: patatin-like phospholipase family protein, partial [Bryobacteraceae bacterium]